MHPTLIWSLLSVLLMPLLFVSLIAIHFFGATTCRRAFDQL